MALVHLVGQSEVVAVMAVLRVTLQVAFSEILFHFLSATDRLGEVVEVEETCFPKVAAGAFLEWPSDSSLVVEAAFLEEASTQAVAS